MDRGLPQSSTSVEIVCSSRELFGADRSALRLGEVLTSLGKSVTLVMPADRPERGLVSAARERGLAIDIRAVPIVSSRGVEGVRLIDHRKPRSTYLSVANTSAVLHVGNHAQRRITMVREWLDPYSVRHRALTLHHSRRSHGVCAVSSGVMRQWRACARGPRVGSVIHNWLDASTIAEARTPSFTASRWGKIICLGRFNQWKGQQTLADAFCRAFPDEDDRPSLCFVGAQRGTDYEARAIEIARQGEQAGWTVREFEDDPGSVMREASLVVVPSLHPEPFGMVILEALAHGCRVIAFPGGGPDDLVAPFDHALEIVDRSPEALADALLRWWYVASAAPQTATELDTTLSRIESGFSPEAAARYWTHLLSRL
jgi:glycosyltransferase involved in cell wall biosynthesis